MNVENVDLVKLAKVVWNLQKNPVPLTYNRMENLSPQLESGHMQN